MRWRAIFHLQDNENETSSNDEDNETSSHSHFGFNSPNTPSEVPELKYFKQDTWDLVDSATVNFSEKRTKFQNILQKDVREIHKSKNMCPV